MEYSDEIFDPFYKFGKLINFISVRILCLIKKQKKKKEMFGEQSININNYHKIKNYSPFIPNFYYILYSDTSF